MRLFARISARRTPEPTVDFHPESNPPGVLKFIDIIPHTSFLLRDSLVWIPVQVYDVVSLHLSSRPATNLADCNYHHQPAYIDLLNTISSITSYPLTPKIIAEIQQMRHGHPSTLPHDPTPRQRQKWEALKAFDEKNEKFIVRQRERAKALQRPNARLYPARVPKPFVPASVRKKLNKKAEVRALRKAMKLRREVEEMWAEDEKVGKGKGKAKVGEEDEVVETGLMSHPAPPQKLRKKRRVS